MPRPEKSYKAVITAIHSRRKGPFAIWEISHDTGFSRPTVSRLFDRLKLMGYMTKAVRGFSNRVWRTRLKWPEKSCKVVIEEYELWQIAAGDRTVDIS